MLSIIEARSMPEPNSGCWLWLGRVNAKWGQALWRKKAGFSIVYRAAWFAVNGPIPSGMCVCHRCDIPSCVNPAHLFLGTNKDNSADMVRKQRQARGEEVGTAKLTADSVRAIRSAKGRVRDIAPMFGVGKSTVSLIKRGEIWGHLT